MSGGKKNNKGRFIGGGVAFAALSVAAAFANRRRYETGISVVKTYTTRPDGSLKVELINGATFRIGQSAEPALEKSRADRSQVTYSIDRLRRHAGLRQGALIS